MNTIEMEIEKDLRKLIERMENDEKDLNACYEYSKLYTSATYLEFCGYIELPSHKDGTFSELEDYSSIAKRRIEDYKATLIK